MHIDAWRLNQRCAIRGERLISVMPVLVHIPVAEAYVIPRVRRLGRILAIVGEMLCVLLNGVWAGRCHHERCFGGVASLGVVHAVRGVCAEREKFGHSCLRFR